MSPCSGRHAYHADLNVSCERRGSHAPVWIEPAHTPGLCQGCAALFSVQPETPLISETPAMEQRLRTPSNGPIQYNC